MNAMRTMGIAGLLLAVGIVVGALAAHALQRVLEPRQIESLHTAVNYQLFNALGLLLIGLLMRDDPSGGARRAGAASSPDRDSAGTPCAAGEP